MAELPALLSLAGSALGAIGGVLVFVEFFQTPNYIEYRPDWGGWHLEYNPNDVNENTWAGRIGALLVAVAFALQFVGGLL